MAVSLNVTIPPPSEPPAQKCPPGGILLYLPSRKVSSPPWPLQLKSELHKDFCTHQIQTKPLHFVLVGYRNRILRGNTTNTVTITVFDALSIGSGLVAAVLLCMKRENI